MDGFFDISRFPARWHCGDWSPTLGWITIGSDLAIFCAYTAIPLTILWYMKSRREVPFPLVFWLFGAFIFACGATHLVETVIFWYPIYPVQAVLKVFTAIASVATVIATAAIMPKALAIPGMAAMNQRLQDEIVARTASQDELLRRSEELQRSEARLILAQQAARIGDWSFDTVSQQITWSAEIYRLFGRQSDLGPPKDLAENMALYTPRGAQALGAMMTSINDGSNRAEGTLEVLLPYGAIAWHHAIIHAQRADDGTVTRLWGTAQDITAQKLDELAKDQQRQELERINQQLEQFAYIASHDLLEPLRKMRFFTDVITEESHGRLTPDGDDALKRLHAASERMARLVRDLLAFARAGKSLIAVKPVALADVVKEALGDCEAMIRDTGAIITVESMPVVMGDQILLEQVFQNLLVNAMRYRDPTRVSTITVSGERVDGRVRIRVRDNGLGFAADQAGRMFDPFVRLHPHIPNEGTGIGLAICRRIVEAHGGQITGKPAADVGAEFTIILPLSKDASHGH